MNRWLVLVAAASCGCLTVPMGREPPARVATPVASRGVALEVIALQTGHATAPRCGPAGGASCLSLMPLVYGAYAVKHPKATFLIDSGVASGKQDVSKFSFFVRQAVDYTPDRTLTEALPSSGIEHVDFVILTHGHWDHAGGLLELHSPRVLVGPGEPGYLAASRERKEPLVQLRHFRGSQIETIDWDGATYEGFERSHDVFSDGSVVIVPLAGHTPGSVGVFLSNVHGRRLFFIGDAAWSRDAVSRPSHKLRPLSALTDNDRDATSETLWRIHQFAQREPSLLIIPAHDGEAMAEVRQLSARP